MAPRVPGFGWEVQITDTEGEYHVLNVSRMGICLEGTRPMKVDSRYSTTLYGPAGAAVLDFVVLRCSLHRDPVNGETVYQIGGLFTVILDRADLPAKADVVR
jgi:hypothetical protein